MNVDIDVGSGGGSTDPAVAGPRPDSAVLAWVWLDAEQTDHDAGASWEANRPRRYVVLEVLDRAPKVMILVSGYGPESDWFRNICADPRVRVWSGRIRNVPARTTVLSEAETRARLHSYRLRNPRLHSYRLRNRRAAAALGRILGIAELASTDSLPDDIAERLPLVQVEVMSQ